MKRFLKKVHVVNKTVFIPYCFILALKNIKIDFLDAYAIG